MLEDAAYICMDVTHACITYACMDVTQNGSLQTLWCVWWMSSHAKSAASVPALLHIVLKHHEIDRTARPGIWLKFLAYSISVMRQCVYARSCMYSKLAKNFSKNVEAMSNIVSKSKRWRETNVAWREFIPVFWLDRCFPDVYANTTLVYLTREYYIICRFFCKP